MRIAVPESGDRDEPEDVALLAAAVSASLHWETSSAAREPDSAGPAREWRPER